MFQDILSGYLSYLLRIIPGICCYVLYMRFWFSLVNYMKYKLSMKTAFTLIYPVILISSELLVSVEYKENKATNNFQIVHNFCLFLYFTKLLKENLMNKLRTLKNFVIWKNEESDIFVIIFSLLTLMTFCSIWILNYFGIEQIKSCNVTLFH